ncbi:hypothetical protein RvY_15101 [Ramazzottius varieornatus]|uniref:Uncharacterized protein n=1 Tax=Ramazzottius varieornatus TaxID=947166 RepID=A0A1D1VTP6_RAMVA|nr:hypothetical protein RvY_15101 [Ramazzottius varieornatus]
MFGGMIGAYAPYQISGLITGFPMGFPLGPRDGSEPTGHRSDPTGCSIHQPRRSGHPAVKPSRPSSQLLPCISGYQQPVGTGQPDVKINLGSIGPSRKPFAHRRLGNQLPHHRNSNRNRGWGYGRRGGAYGSDGRGGGRGGGRGAGRGSGSGGHQGSGRDSDGQRGNCPRNCGGGWPRKAISTSTRRARRINLPSVLSGSKGEPKSAKKTLATDSKNPTTHMDQLEHQTGSDGTSRTWKWSSEHLDEGGKNAPSFVVWWLALPAMVVRVFHVLFGA